MQKLVFKRPVATKSSQRSVVITCQSINIPTKIALKEWTPACRALYNGDQTVILRKGGIKEPIFTTKAPSFLLFPTAFHTTASLLKHDLQEKYNKECEIDPKENAYLQFDCIAEVTGQWKTTDSQVLGALDSLHIYGPNFLEARLRWRPTQPLTILELRAYKLSGPPVVVAAKEEFWGCFSWVNFENADFIKEKGDFFSSKLFEEKSIEELVQKGYLSPALDADTFIEKQKLCRHGLSQLTDLENI